MNSIISEVNKFIGLNKCRKAIIWWIRRKWMIPLTTYATAHLMSILEIVTTLILSLGARILVFLLGLARILRYRLLFCLAAGSRELELLRLVMLVLLLLCWLEGSRLFRISPLQSDNFILIFLLRVCKKWGHFAIIVNKKGACHRGEIRENCSR